MAVQAAKAGAMAPAAVLSRDSRSSSYDHAEIGVFFGSERGTVAPATQQHQLHQHLHAGRPQPAHHQLEQASLLFCAEPADAALAAAVATTAPPPPPQPQPPQPPQPTGAAAPAVPLPPALSLQHNGVALEDLLAMIRHQRDREAELAPSSTHLEDAHGRAASGDEFVTPQMRLIVASWVVEVAEEFGLQQETLHLSVTLLDRFLSSTRGVPRGVLQLAAVAAVLVASKEQEVSHPSVGRLTAISANCFRAEDLLRMERILLDALEFRVSSPTAFTFLHLYVQALAMMGAVAPPPPPPHLAPAAAAAAAGHHHSSHGSSGASACPPPAAGPQQPPLPLLSTAATYTAAYLVELAMLDYAMLAYPPSVVAAAALVVGALSAADGAEAAAADEQQQQQAQQQWGGGGAEAFARPHARAHAQASAPLLAARLALVSGFPPSALQSCAAALLRLHRAAAWPDSPAAAELLLPVRSKFGSDAWCRAAHAAPLAALPAPFFRCCS